MRDHHVSRLTQVRVHIEEDDIFIDNILEKVINSLSIHINDDLFQILFQVDRSKRGVLFELTRILKLTDKVIHHISWCRFRTVFIMNDFQSLANNLFDRSVVGSTAVTIFYFFALILNFFSNGFSLLRVLPISHQFRVLGAFIFVKQDS